MEPFSALLALCAWNSPVSGEFSAQRPVTRSFDVFFDLRVNKRFSKQSWGWWFETLSRSLWRHRNEILKESPFTGGFPTQRTSNAEILSMSWRNLGHENYKVVVCTIELPPSSSSPFQPCIIPCPVRHTTPLSFMNSWSMSSTWSVWWGILSVNLDIHRFAKFT